MKKSNKRSINGLIVKYVYLILIEITTNMGNYILKKKVNAYLPAKVSIAI
jgi:hypothetical protein